MKEKVCTKCGLKKPLREFSKRNDRYIGYLSQCKECKKLSRDEWYKTKHGLIKTIYRNQCKTSKRRNHKNPEYSLQEFEEFLFNNDVFNKLYEIWRLSKYKKELIPSIDRLDDLKGYGFNNIRLATFKENNEKSNKQMREGIIKTRIPQKKVIQFDLQKNFINGYISLSEASRRTGISVSSISRVCLNKRSNTCGYIFEFAY